MRKVEACRKRRRELVERIYAGEEDLRGVAAAMKLELGKLTDLADKKVVRTLGVLKALEDLRNEHFLNRYKAHAILRLVQLLRQEKDPDLARRSCVDLLRTELRRAGKRRGKAGVTKEQEMEGAVDEGKVMEMLRQIGSGGGDLSGEPRRSSEDGAATGLGGEGEIHE